MQSEKDFSGAVWLNPHCRTLNQDSRGIAIIGCGNYAFSNIAYYLYSIDKNFLRATYDLVPARARSLCARYRGGMAVKDWRVIRDDPNVKLVFIASNHASHSDFAVEMIRAGKHVHIEKPHVVSQDQLNDLIEAMKAFPLSLIHI